MALPGKSRNDRVMVVALLFAVAVASPVSEASAPLGDGPRVDASRPTADSSVAPIAPLRDIGQPPTPTLIPAFDPTITDYVARCNERAVTGRRTSFKVRRNGRTTTHHVRCLPADFPDWTVERTKRPEAGWYVVTPTIFGPGGHYVVIFDDRGVPVWWLRSVIPPLDAKLLPDGTVAFARFFGGGSGTNAAGAYEIRALDGSLIREVQTVGSPTDHHELEVLANGNVAILTYRRRDHVDLSAFGFPADASVADAEVQELDSAGNVVWSWNSKDHIGLEETNRWYALAIANGHPAGGTVYDIVHANAIEEDGDGLLLSMRHNDAIYRIDRATGDVTWKLGGTRTPQSLSVALDPNLTTGLFGGQHDVRVLEDGTITLHDNGTGRGRAPRAVRYAIDSEARQATLVEDVRDVAAPTSFCCGSARRLPGGNWVTSWGGTSEVAELTPAGTPVLRLRFADQLSTYRAVPYLRGEISRHVLRAGMDAQAIG